MKKIPKSLLVIILLIIAAKVAWDVAYPSGTWRYKMTVVVETPEGIKTGSAVREVSWMTGPKLLPEACGFCVGFTKGEAVIVDLSPKGVLFGLVAGGITDSYLIVNAFSSKTKPGVGEKVILTGNQYPTFVHFKDQASPITAERVYPNNLETTFGRGVKVKEVTIEVTDEPVTTGIINFLPWLPDYYEKMFDGQRYNTIKTNYPFANSLSAGVFSSEVHRGR